MVHDNELPTTCQDVLLCSRKDNRYAFENVMNEFEQYHLKKENVEVVDRALPNLGGDEDILVTSRKWSVLRKADI